MTQTRPGVTTAHVRTLNRSAILAALRKEGTATLSHLAQVTGMTRPTALTALEMLIGQGLAEETAARAGLQGRPARRYRFLPGAGHVLGVAVRREHSSVVTTDLDGTVIARDRIDLPADTPGAERLERTRQLAAACAERTGEIWAAGVATSGIVDSAGRVTRASQLEGWTGLDLAGTVGAWFDCPAVAANDGGAAAVGERWQGSAVGADDVVLLLTGRPIGQGFLLDGRMYEGRTGAAGELGRIQHRYNWDPSALITEWGTTFEQISTDATAGDPVAAGRLRDVAARTAEVASVLVSVLDPALVVIAGDYASGGDVFRDLVVGGLAVRASNPPPVALSTLGEDVVALGAARLGLTIVEDADHVRPGAAGTVDG